MKKNFYISFNHFSILWYTYYLYFGRVQHKIDQEPIDLSVIRNLIENELYDQT